MANIASRMKRLRSGFASRVVQATTRRYDGHVLQSLRLETNDRCASCLEPKMAEPTTRLKSPFSAGSPAQTACHTPPAACHVTWRVSYMTHVRHARRLNHPVSDMRSRVAGNTS